MVAHGPALLLAVLVGLALGYPLAGATAALAFLATTVRWGSGWLVAVSGAQAVLGSAIVVGPVAASASCWLAAASLIVAVPDRSIVTAAGVGTAAAFLAAGPGGWGGVLVRILATALAIAAAVGVARLGHARRRALGAVALGVAALALAIAA
jgi:hypothetical protein